jgi:hypothetical protein
MQTRIFVVRLNVIEPLGVSLTDAELIESLNEKGVEVLEEIPADKYEAVKPVAERLMMKIKDVDSSKQAAMNPLAQSTGRKFR